MHIAASDVIDVNMFAPLTVISVPPLTDPSLGSILYTTAGGEKRNCAAAVEKSIPFKDTCKSTSVKLVTIGLMFGLRQEISFEEMNAALD
jgi:hypothetical protein